MAECLLAGWLTYRTPKMLHGITLSARPKRKLRSGCEYQIILSKTDSVTIRSQLVLSRFLENQVTIPPLPDTDLARIAPLDEDMKRSQLRQMKGGFSTFSYKHVRGCFNEIFNVEPPMFGPSEPTPFQKIKDRLSRQCKAGVEFENNKKIAEALHHYATGEGIKGRHHEFFPMSMGVGRKVSFWLPMILAIEERAHVLFIDPRRTKGLTAAGRRFAFSMMHERIRVADPDFADVRLGIVRFTDGDEGDRVVRLYTDEGVDLYPLDELEAMVASTYRMWQEVVEEREAESRRRSTGTGGLF